MESQDDKTKKTKEKKERKFVNYFQLYRFATSLEIILIFFGIIFTAIKAFGMPLMIIVYGEFTTLLVDRAYGIGTSSKTVLLHLFGGGKSLTNATMEENLAEIINDSVSYGILMTIVAAIQFVAGIISIDIFNYTALKQITRIRKKFFESLMKQEIGWYDVSEGNSFAVRIADDVEKIREGIAEKVSHFCGLIMGFVICVAVSFAYGWKLTLVVITYVPVLLITNTIVARFQAILSAREINAYASASSVVEEVLGGIRTVTAFCGEKVEAERYDRLLKPAQKAGIRKGLASGIGECIMRFMFFASNSLAYWYGVKLILEDRDKDDKDYTPAVLMITFFGLIVGAENIAKTAPFLECFAAARGSAATIFNIIDRKSKIDSMSSSGKIIDSGMQGNLEFERVVFQYPSRPEVEVLRELSIKIKAGETVALVGSSGNGKSTCLQLIQRFYDPIEGRIYIDGQNIKDFHISWLRSHIAVVGQEPCLFSTTILDNIRYGKPDATEKEIEEAAKDSGAHDFIIKLPKGYETTVGESGSQLSGGQKQRIAIARALIQNPKILLLDEATSALDSQSEKLVQETLDRICKGRTTIVVSHRLSAIRHANRIVYIEKGKIMEDGSHSELISLKGYYYKMVRASYIDHENLEVEVNINKFAPEQLDHDKIADKQLFTDQHVQFAPAPYDNDEDQFGKIKYWSTFGRILKVAKPEWCFLIIALISAMIIGASFPAFSILFGEFYGALSYTDANEASESTNLLCISFLIIGIIVGFSALLQSHLFNLASVYLTTRIRSSTFSAMIRQEMGWFDDDNNAIGALSARLTGDAANVQGAIGYPLSGIMQSISNFAFGVAVAFVYSWKLALVCLSTVPLVIASVIFEGKSMARSAKVEKLAMENVTKIGIEAISNIRTVASLRQEPHIILRYNNEMDRVEKIVRKKIALRGLVNSTGQSIPFFGYAMALYYGGILVATEGVHFSNIIKVSEALLYGAMMLGQSLVFVPSFTSAFVAATRVFKIIDRKSRVRSPELYNLKRKPDNANNISFNKIEFRYPKRPDIKILNGLELEVMEGKTIALVGSSGCGKSTCIQLLQRFYDPDNGRIYIGNDEIASDISLVDLRTKLSIVSQEPVLFDRTIAENIAYGDNSREIDITEIMEAAKIANIHDFIKSLPLGYDTSIGAKGTQISGGQKQRIAIARALVRNPKILLLDEATSALDLQSEKIVQCALDIARAGRTCLVIAHRLSTIQNADLIYVLQNGRVHERGTHNQLMAQGGFYSRLYKMQPGVN